MQDQHDRHPVVAARREQHRACAAIDVAGQGPFVTPNSGPAALDNASDQQVYAPNRDRVKRRIVNHRRVRAIIGAPEHVALQFQPKSSEPTSLSRRTDQCAPSTSSSTAAYWRANRSADYALPGRARSSDAASVGRLDFINMDDEVAVSSMVEQVRRRGWSPGCRQGVRRRSRPGCCVLASSGSHLGDCGW